MRKVCACTEQGISSELKSVSRRRYRSPTEGAPNRGSADQPDWAVLFAELEPTTSYDQARTE